MSDIVKGLKEAVRYARETKAACYFDKVPFPDEAMAKREADRVNRSRTARRRCQNCGAWHVGGEAAAPVHYLVRLASNERE